MLTAEERQYLAKDTARLIDGGMGEVLLYTAPVVAKLLDALSASEAARAGLRKALDEASIALVEAANLVNDLSQHIPGIVPSRYSLGKVVDAQVNARAALARDAELK